MQVGCSVSACAVWYDASNVQTVPNCVLFRYCADQLTWLITKSLGSAPMDVMARLQEDIDDCDRKGGRDATVPADEKLDDFVLIVASAESRQDVEEVIVPLLSG